MSDGDLELILSAVIVRTDRLSLVLYVYQHRAETGVEEVNSELQRHRDTLTSLSKQMKLLRHVPLKVATLRDDLLNIIAQFPPGNHQIISVYTWCGANECTACKLVIFIILIFSRLLFQFYYFALHHLGLHLSFVSCTICVFIRAVLF